MQNMQPAWDALPSADRYHQQLCDFYGDVADPALFQPALDERLSLYYDAVSCIRYEPDAFPSLKNQKLAFYTLFIFIGGLFHNSLWFVYPLYFILPKKFSRKTIGCLLFFTISVYLCFDPLFSLIRPLLPEKYAIYQQSYFWYSNQWEYAVPPALYLLLICLFQNRIKDPSRRNIYLNSALLYFLISVFITKHFILKRFAAYPFVFSLFAIPDILSSYQKDCNCGCELESRTSARKYTCVTLLFLLYGGAFFLFAASKGFHNVYPYVSLLDQSRSVPDLSRNPDNGY